MFEKTFIINAYVTDTKEVIFSFEIQAVSVQRLNGHSFIADGVSLVFSNVYYVDCQVK